MSAFAQHLGIKTLGETVRPPPLRREAAEIPGPMQRRMTRSETLRQLSKDVIAGRRTGEADQETLTEAMFVTCAKIPSDVEVDVIASRIRPFLDRGARLEIAPQRHLRDMFKARGNENGAQAVRNILAASGDPFAAQIRH